MGDAHPLGPGDAVLQKTPISFDVSVWELFWPLARAPGWCWRRRAGTATRSTCGG